MTDDKQPITEAEAVRMLDAYMNPARKLKGYKHTNPNAEREIEVVASVQEMIDEGNPIPAKWRTLADVMEKKSKEITESRAAARVQLQETSSRWMKGGYRDLERYKENNGSGVHLFRAYLNRRKADRQQDETRKRSLEAKREEAKRGRTRRFTEDEAVELLRLDILDALDPVIDDLLMVCKVCEEGKPNSNEILTELRSALRIGRGRSPCDAAQDTTRRKAIYLWWQAFTASTTVSRSRSVTAAAIAKELNISKRTALNYLEQGQRENPVLRRIVGETATRAGKVADVKSPKSRTGPRRGFTYGKGKRANQ
jgi:hypothetical protein